MYSIIVFKTGIYWKELYRNDNFNEVYNQYRKYMNNSARYPEGYKMNLLKDGISIADFWF